MLLIRKQFPTLALTRKNDARKCQTPFALVECEFPAEYVVLSNKKKSPFQKV